MNFDVRLQLSRLIEVGKYEHAERLLRRTFAEAPSDPDAHYFAAQIAAKRERFEPAREHLENVIRSAPESYDGRLLLAEVADQQKRYAEAERILLELLGERPESAYLYARYAQVMLHTLHVDKARELTNEALRLAPNEPLGQLMNVLIAVIRGDRDAARQGLAELVARSPGARHVALSMVTVLASEHRYREAFRIAQTVLRETPSDAGLVELIVELRARTHWVSIPTWPIRRFGWGGVFALWAAVGITVRLLRPGHPTAADWLLLSWVAYCVYSWAYRPMLVKWLKARGV